MLTRRKSYSSAFILFICLLGHQDGKDLGCKRQKWKKEEQQAVKRHLGNHLASGKVPGKKDCLNCIMTEPKVLGARTWRDVKNYVHNTIRSKKRKRNQTDNDNDEEGDVALEAAAKRPRRKRRRRRRVWIKIGHVGFKGWLNRRWGNSLSYTSVHTSDTQWSLLHIDIDEWVNYKDDISTSLFFHFCSDFVVREQPEEPLMITRRWPTFSPSASSSVGEHLSCLLDRHYLWHFYTKPPASCFDIWYIKNEQCNMVILNCNT